MVWFIGSLRVAVCIWLDFFPLVFPRNICFYSLYLTESSLKWNFWKKRHNVSPLKKVSSKIFEHRFLSVSQDLHFIHRSYEAFVPNDSHELYHWHYPYYNGSIILPFWRCPWCNGYRRRKWTRRHEFKSWTRLIAFLKALIPLGKVWIQLFSLQLWVNSRTDWVLQLWWGN